MKPVFFSFIIILLLFVFSSTALFCQSSGGYDISVVEYLENTGSFVLMINGRKYAALLPDKAAELLKMQVDFKEKEKELTIYRSLFSKYESLVKEYADLVEESKEVIEIDNEYIGTLEENIALYEELIKNYKKLKKGHTLSFLGSLGFTGNFNPALLAGVQLWNFNLSIFLQLNSLGDFLVIEIPIF